ncbi:MAG: DMT family transporter [Oscillospiraceae bacterium]|nr:DMT family transporter [Oscillospiraceae bacterium]
MKNHFRGSLALILATVIWGSAFVAQSVGMDLIGPFTFQSVRCILAVAFLVIVLWISNPKGFFSSWRNPKLWKAGVPCGIALFAASGLQQMGMVYTDAGKAGFLTAMYIVLVPILGLFLKKKPPKTAFFSVILAVAGLYLLSCVGVTSINVGDFLLIGCALAFAVQITLVDRLSQDLNGMQLNCVQCMVNAVLSIITMFLFEDPKIGPIVDCWLPLCYTGILSLGVAYTLQIVGQQYLEPTAASLIMSLESVFAVLTGWLILHETLSPAEAAGCVLVFIAIILSQIPEKIFKLKK